MESVGFLTIFSCFSVSFCLIFYLTIIISCFKSCFEFGTLKRIQLQPYVCCHFENDCFTFNLFFFQKYQIIHQQAIMKRVKKKPYIHLFSIIPHWNQINTVEFIPRARQLIWFFNWKEIISFDFIYLIVYLAPAHYRSIDAISWDQSRTQLPFGFVSIVIFGFILLQT